MRALSICMLLLVGGLPAVASEADARTGESSAAAARPLAGLLGGSNADSFRKSVSMISDPQVFEGLPDPKTEPALFARESVRDDVMPFGGWSFYKRPLELNAAELAELRAIFHPGNPFAPGGGQDPCGRFHPDYLIVWKDRESTFYALIGLGCQEIEAVSPSCRLHHYISPDSYARLDRVLGRHSPNRPQTPP